MLRIGHGYDVHAFSDNRKCIIGGVEIPYEKGLLGHSDADVLLHAISDSLLGAAALGDIGKHFPDTQAPKMAPYIRQMRQNIADALKVDVDFVNVKATTEEKLGFTGRKEGISAHCVCLIESK